MDDLQPKIPRVSSNWRTRWATKKSRYCVNRDVPSVEVLRNCQVIVSHMRWQGSIRLSQPEDIFTVKNLTNLKFKISTWIRIIRSSKNTQIDNKSFQSDTILYEKMYCLLDRRCEMEHCRWYFYRPRAKNLHYFPCLVLSNPCSDTKIWEPFRIDNFLTLWNEGDDIVFPIRLNFRRCRRREDSKRWWVLEDESESRSTWVETLAGCVKRSSVGQEAGKWELCSWIYDVVFHFDKLKLIKLSLITAVKVKSNS